MMVLKLFLTLFPLLCFSSSVTLKSFDTLMHENEGCPINSFCSKDSGKTLKSWEDHISKISEKNKVKKLNQFKKKSGLPIIFLTNEKAKTAIDPIMWKSRCEIHNPRNPSSKKSKALKFFKNLPKSDLVVLTPVRVYDGLNITDYKIPYQDQVNFLKNGKIILLKDYDDFYYQIAVDAKGGVEVVNHSHKLLNLALDKKVTETKCPDSMTIDKSYFAKSYCQKVLDLDTNDLKIIQYGWTCP